MKPTINLRTTPIFLGLSPLIVAAAFAQGSAVAPHAGPAAPIICIDPGHPSEVGRGATGRHITEIQAAWQVAKRMEAILKKEGVRIILTKTSENQLVKNKRRAEIANEAHADLMVRLHCDGGNGIGSGFAVYCPARQGHADGAVGPTKEVIEASEKAADTFYHVLRKDLTGQIRARGLHPDTATRVGGMQGALTGSVFAKEPVLLVEMCVLTEPSDDAWISSPYGRNKMAQALADAAMAAVKPAPTK